MNQLEGKVVAVTGAAASIGRSIAIRFARDGAKVALIDQDAAKCVSLVEEIQSTGGAATLVRGDVALKGDARRAVDAAADAYGRLDVLVNANWTQTSFAPLLEKPDEDFETSMNTVFFGTLAAMRAAVPHMRKVGGGRIINVAAPYGYTSFHNIADAVCSDWILQGLTRVAAVEWGKYQILTNLLIPALLDIPEFRQYRAENAAYVEGLIKQMPLRRLGDPIEDLGGAALFLACDEGCFITGQPIFADGGQHLNTATFKPRASHA